jgi:hypothetical protein
MEHWALLTFMFFGLVTIVAYSYMAMNSAIEKHGLGCANSERQLWQR